MRRPAPPVPVPADRLETATLRRLCRELVLREDENDDPGGLEARLDAAVSSARAGRVRLWFHPSNGTVTWTQGEGAALSDNQPCALGDAPEAAPSVERADPSPARASSGDGGAREEY